MVNVTSATELRRSIQDERAQFLCEMTRADLKRVIALTRIEHGGLAILEVAEVIREAWTPEEVESLKNDL